MKTLNASSLIAACATISPTAGAFAQQVGHSHENTSAKLNLRCEIHLKLRFIRACAVTTRPSNHDSPFPTCLVARYRTHPVIF